MQFDIATAMLMDAVVTFLAGVLMLLVSLTPSHRLRSELRLWGIADVLIALGLVALGLRAVIGELASVVLTNGLLLSGIVYQYVALRRFNGFTSNPLRFLPWLCVVLILLGISTSVWSLLSFRIALVGSLLCVAGVLISREALRSRKPDAPVAAILMAGVFLLLAALFLGLTIKQLVGVQSAGLFEINGPIPVLALVGGGLLPLLGAVAFLLMCVERSLGEAHQLAITDSLTRCHNRRWIEELARRQLISPAPAESRFALLLVDLDHFKRVNDTNGHAAGDMVLREVVNRIQRVLHKRDALGRFGGEEFVALLHASDAHHAMRMAEQIRSAIGATPIDVGGPQLAITVSIGVAVHEIDGESLDELLGRADRALYRAKNAGRNRVAFEAPRSRECLADC
ncbi:MAG TPA: GGDEF domain-containing protein [Dokdonella sp.]|uniref:GGDEF domain-containing protein n=1 Tax=Dokdonella sp. TaxID=2291710 RepID=UPI002D7EE2C8|nr:GGDEF domain-containing protein [Dokdonella sp.]HET9032815.1 GGDEF domain-containing protein [Dokdonella sp.]